MYTYISRESFCEQPLYFSDNMHFAYFADMIRTLKKATQRESTIPMLYRDAILDCRRILEEYRFDEFRPGLLATYLFLFLPDKTGSKAAIKNLRRYRRDIINKWLERGVDMYQEGLFLGQWIAENKDTMSADNKNNMLRFFVRRCGCIHRRSDICDLLSGMYECLPKENEALVLNSTDVRLLNFVWDKDKDYAFNAFLNLKKMKQISSEDYMADVYYRIILHQKRFFNDPKIQHVLNTYLHSDSYGGLGWVYPYAEVEENQHSSALYELNAWLAYEPDVLDLLPSWLLEQIPVAMLKPHTLLTSKLEEKLKFNLQELEPIITIMPGLQIKNAIINGSGIEHTLYI